MSLVFGCSCRLEQVLVLVKDFRTSAKTSFTEERLQECVRIAAAESKPNIEGVIEQN
jgi:hypothetical protein